MKFRLRLSVAVATAAICGALLLTAAQLPVQATAAMRDAQPPRQTIEARQLAPQDVADVVEHYQNYVGLRIKVRGEVDNVIAPGVYRLGSEERIGQELIVISPDLIGQRPASGPFVDDDVVDATGRLATMVITEIEREIGLDLDPQVEVELEGAMVVFIAESANVVPKAQERRSP